MSNFGLRQMKKGKMNCVKMVAEKIEVPRLFEQLVGTEKEAANSETILLTN